MTLETQRPAFTEDDAAELLASRYGLWGALAPLPSERDQNFRVTTPDGDRFVLKIAGADEPTGHLEMQHAALGWLAERAPGLPVPHVVPAQSGDALTSVEGRTGRAHGVRVLTYLSGRPLATVRPRTPALLRDLGSQLAAMDLALHGFRHPTTRRDFVWDIARAPDVIEQARHAVPGTRQGLLDRVLALWRGIVEPTAPQLRRQVVYNDANDHNVLVESTGIDQRISGFVDFGDLLESHLVADPAIAVAYAMLGSHAPLAAAAEVVQGYHAVVPLVDEELDVLLPFALARLAVSVCLSAARRAEAPDNHYLTVSEAPAWQVLERLTTLHHRLARSVIRAACGLPPAPQSPAVVEWIDRHRGTFAPVVEPDPAAVPTTILDLSVGTTDFPDADRQTGTEASVAPVFRYIAARHARIGIGRYSEARLIYLTDAFTGPDGEHPERRTVHLGIDLFMEAGAQVCAPLDGIVHAVRDNCAPLDYGPTVILRHTPADGPTFFTLYGHLNPDCLALTAGTTVSRGHAFARIGCFEDNGHWPPHLHFQIVTDLLDRDGEFPGVAAPSEREAWLSLSPDPTAMLGLPADSRASSEDAAELLVRRQECLGPNLSVSYTRPLHIVRGRGQFLYDAKGRAFLDCVNNVCHVGHANPRVVEAAAQQMAVLNTNTRYLHEHILRYADALRALLPEPLGVCYFVNSGSEANDLALRMARAATGGEHLVVLEGAYHGHTAALIDASPYKHDGPGGAGAPADVHSVVMPDDYRGPYRREDPDCGTRYAERVARAFDVIRSRGAKPAAFISETMLSCGGQIELPPGYLDLAYQAAREAGAVCIADEVQVGFGRMGTHFWGFEAQGVVPDIVTLGKPIGNGHPLGAVVTTPEIARAFDTGMEYFNTYGGNPVSCAVGLAVLDVIRDERLQERALVVGTRLKDGLGRLIASHPIVGDVRGRGLFLGVELVRDHDSREPATDEARYVVDRAKDHGILLSTDGPDRNVIKIKPPLVFAEADADRLVAVLDAVLGEDVPRLLHSMTTEPWSGDVWPIPALGDM
jgi:4-aminobutyrate aminotransferase-like enzyme/Ser/Thr protein kinase RdoA (MazF antagonist)